nr:MAG TPA: Structural protein [Crassvirales sp.]
MATFSINQVRHLYVEKALKTDNNLLSTDAAGSILPKADTAKTTLYFQYMSPAGIVSSDKITIANIISAKATASGSMAHKLARYEVTLSALAPAPVQAQEYVLRLAFRQYIGLGEDDQYFKYGFVKATSGMTASNFYKALALSLAKNIANETTPLVNIYLNSKAATGTDVPVTSTTKEAELNKADYDKIIIEEVQQDWILGKMPQAFIPFSVQPTTITVDGEEITWGDVKKVASTKKVENGHNIADLEYFCMGARGDMYRGMGYPNNITTTYLVDPSKKYDTLDIHYSYIGSNESVQKSERTITIVCEDDGSHTLMKALVAAVNAASGLSIANPA